MARTREFDEDKALEDAMELFWRQGFAETSMRDVSAYTGVAHAGLYAAFGDKSNLYLSALKRYQHVIGGMIFNMLEAEESARTEIESFFYMMLGLASSAQFSNGCMICNTAVEFRDSDHEIADIARSQLERMASAFEGALTRAKARGEVRADLDPQGTASLFTATFQGLSVFARSKMPMSHAKRAVETALAFLD